MRFTSNQFASKSASKHYQQIDPFIRIANLLPWSIRNGVRGVDLGDGWFVAEGELPNTEAIRNLPQSHTARRILIEQQKIVRRTKWDAAEKKAVLNKISGMIPSAAQLRIFEAAHSRFLRSFPEERAELGPQTWLLRGNPLVLYAIYAAVVEAFTDIAKGGIQIGQPREHIVGVAIPFPFSHLSIIWHSDKPAIDFVSNILLDGFRDALRGFDPRRIKRCPVCGSFFLARRLDKGACSPECLNINRVRRHRAKSAQYELTRKLKT